MAVRSAPGRYGPEAGAALVAGALAALAALDPHGRDQARRDDALAWVLRCTTALLAEARGLARDGGRPLAAVGARALHSSASDVDVRPALVRALRDTAEIAPWGAGAAALVARFGAARTRAALAALVAPADPPSDAPPDALASASPALLGAVYEALRGTDVAERRRAGAHFTPERMAGALVRDALEPRLAGTTEALAALRVCDPAMGAGVFLLEACALLGDALAARESGAGAETPSGVEERGRARRAVVARCLYGVDRDARCVAAALASLWLLCATPGDRTPLRAHNLRAGDALVGLARRDLDAGGALSARERARLAKLAAAVRTSRVALRAGHAERAGAKLARAEARALAVARRAGDAVFAAHAGRTLAAGAFHWALEFPEVFAGDAPGFDVVVANPPFGNAIERRTARPAHVRAYERGRFAPFAAGAYDHCLLFWARALQDLLHEGGRYAWLGPSALLSSEAPWQRWMHARFRPTALTLYPVDAFAGAAVRTTAFVGQGSRAPQGEGGGAGSVRVVDFDAGGAAAESVVRPWPAGDCNWHHVARDAGMGALADSPSGVNVPLGALADVFAGCATGAAYELRPLVEDAREGEGARLVTTGALDRYACHWGLRTQRFLGRDYVFPRWPGGDAPPAVTAARARQQRARVLVGGLTTVLECWLDADGDHAGVVSTWVVAPRAPAEPEALYGLLGAMNSATFSRAYFARHGARSMSGRQTTIARAALAASALPRDVLEPRGLLERTDPPRAALHAALRAAARTLQLTPGGDLQRAARERLAHLAAAALLGRTPDESEADYDWFCARAGLPRATGSLPELLRAFAGGS